jgi:hypothetical protein
MTLGPGLRVAAPVEYAVYGAAGCSFHQLTLNLEPITLGLN